MDWIPLLSGFVGVLVGSLTSIITMHLQHRSDIKRDRAKLALEAALADFKNAHELATHNAIDTEIPPLSVYIHYHTQILELVAEGRLDLPSIARLDEEQEQFLRAAREKFYRMNPNFKATSNPAPMKTCE